MDRGEWFKKEKLGTLAIGMRSPEQRRFQSLRRVGILPQIEPTLELCGVVAPEGVRANWGESPLEGWALSWVEDVLMTCGGLREMIRVQGQRMECPLIERSGNLFTVIGREMGIQQLAAIEPGVLSETRGGELRRKLQGRPHNASKCHRCMDHEIGFRAQTRQGDFYLRRSRGWRVTHEMSSTSTATNFSLVLDSYRRFCQRVEAICNEEGGNPKRRRSWDRTPMTVDPITGGDLKTGDGQERTLDLEEILETVVSQRILSKLEREELILGEESGEGREDRRREWDGDRNNGIGQWGWEEMGRGERGWKDIYEIRREAEMPKNVISFWEEKVNDGLWVLGLA
jgi:hypothetical protein